MMKTTRPWARLCLPAALVFLAATTGAQDKAQKARETRHSIASRSTEGLTVEKRSDGTIGLDLQGRFMYVLTAVPNQEGNLDITCHTGDGGPLDASLRSIQPWLPLRSQTEHRLDVAPLRAPIPVVSVKPAPREEK